MRSSLGQIARHRGCVRPSLPVPVRQFSTSRVAFAEDQNQPSAGPRRTPPRGPRAPAKPPGTQNRDRPARVLDARSFAAARADGELPKILRSPKLRNMRGGNQGQSRKPSFKGKGKGKAKGPQKPRRTRESRRSNASQGDEVREAEIAQFQKEQLAKTRPKPVRHEPREIDYSTLKQTWPSLPTDVNAQSAAILERLTSLSGRFPNGYAPPHELGRRLWKGQNVLFENEAEKAEAMEEVQRLALLRADKLSQQKGDLVEPRKIEFKALGEETTKKLVETFALGKYPTLEAGKNQPAVLGEVIRNLRNNVTYQTPGKRPQFLAKVESLLASSQVKK